MRQVAGAATTLCRAIRGLRQGLCRFLLALGCAWIVIACTGATLAPPVPSGGILRVARLFDPATLDAVRMSLAEDMLLMPLLHQTLLDVHGGTNLIPGAAESWTTSPDQRIYRLKLRPGVRFSNGRLVQASDYVFAMERILNPATAATLNYCLKGIRGADKFASGQAAHVEGLSAPTPDTLVIGLARPDPTFGFVLTGQVAEPPEEVARLGPAYSTDPIGTGPYRVGEWRRGTHLRLVRNPYYHGAEPQHLDGVDVLIGGDETTHLMMFERGELDIANITFSGIPLPSFRRLSQDVRWRDLIEYEEMFTTYFIIMNTEVPPLDNVLVRRAINHAVDRDHWMHVALGYNTHAEGVIPRCIPGFDPTFRGYEYNPESARDLLQQSGLPLPLHTVLWHSMGDDTRFLAQGVQGDLQRVGIDLELKPVTFAQLETSAQIRKRVPMATIGWSCNVPDSIDILSSQFDGRTLGQPSSQNRAYYRNPEVDRLLALAAPEVDLPRRYELCRQIERLVVADAPCVFLAFGNMSALRQRWLKGPIMDPLWMYRLDRLWIEK